jgi:hypothetical protein
LPSTGMVLALLTQPGTAEASVRNVAPVSRSMRKTPHSRGVRRRRTISVGRPAPALSCRCRRPDTGCIAIPACRIVQPDDRRAGTSINRAASLPADTPRSAKQLNVRICQAQLPLPANNTPPKRGDLAASVHSASASRATEHSFPSDRKCPRFSLCACVHQSGQIPRFPKPNRFHREGDSLRCCGFCRTVRPGRRGFAAKHGVISRPSRNAGHQSPPAQAI